MKRPLSMTGFGRGESVGGGKRWTIEIRSVNHRYLDVNIKFPRFYTLLEERIKKEIAVLHSRGRIDLYINVEDEQETASAFKVDLLQAREYYKCLIAIKNELGLEGQPDLTMLAANRDLISSLTTEYDPATVEIQWPFLRKALHVALDECQDMRASEGLVLKQDLLERLAAFETIVAEIDGAVPDLLARRQAALKERLAVLLQDVNVDPARLAQEAAILADRVDITEELVRLRSHITQFRDFLNMTEPVGRRCDFLLQEFLREVNTIASKVNNSSTAHLTVDMKNELEKMREQIQNLE